MGGLPNKGTHLAFDEVDQLIALLYRILGSINGPANVYFSVLIQLEIMCLGRKDIACTPQSDRQDGGPGLNGQDESTFFKRLKEDYHSLFFPLFVVPVESVYKEWAKGGDSPLPHSVKKGYIMGDPAVEMIKRYKMAGIEIPKEFKDTPDHIALLLEYAALLCENIPENSRARFVLEHLDWVEDLRNDIYKYSQSDFYRCIADITVAFIKNERTLFR